MASCRLCDGQGPPCYVAGQFRMYRCQRCRSAFVSPVPSDEFLAEFYATYHRSDDEGGSYDAVEDRMQADFPSKIAMVKWHTGNKPGRLLDVGCGKGYFVRACVDAGIAAEGCDLSVTGVRHAVERLKVPCHHGLLSDLAPRIGTFSTVTLWATIEHLPDPINVLRDVHRILEPGGRLFLDTGIGDDWLDRVVPGAVQWYDPPQHLFVFSAAGLRTAVERAGFTVESHDRNYDRTFSRRVIRTVRNGVTAGVLRVGAELGRLQAGAMSFTRFPMGNLQSLVARKPLA
jgi:SAM-dependent methyltransferase